MKRRPPATIRAQRARLVRVVERRGVNQVRELYDEATAVLGGKLAALTAQGRGQTYDARLHQAVLMQLQDGQAGVSQQIYDELRDIDVETQTESIRGLAVDLDRLLPDGAIQVPIDEAMSLRTLIGRRRGQLDEMHAASLSSWGARTFEKVHKSLSLSLATMETTDQAMARITDPKTGNPNLQWWEAERIVRTEGAWAFNRAHADGIAMAAHQVPELRMRWVEHVDDEGEPLDDRVGEDSIALHGQVVRPGVMFVMPADPDVDPSMWGQAWSHPPNRPNDRSVLAPWFPGLGVMAWEFKRGRRVDLE